VSINLEDLERLAKAASGATLGAEWKRDSNLIYSLHPQGRRDVNRFSALVQPGSGVDREVVDAVAAFIAAANPAAVLELIRLARAANEYFGEKRP
jgi:hypothetical protein